MAKYLVKANYTEAGLPGLFKDGGTGRRDAVEQLAASVGGTVEAFYYAFGETDVYVIIDVPDNVTAAGLSLVINRSGAVNANITALLTPEEVDQATSIAADYRPPGG